MTKQEFENKFDKYGGIAIINNISIHYDYYTIEFEEGEEVVYFYNEGGFALMCTTPLKEIGRLEQELETKNGVVLEIFENKCAWERLARITAIKEFTALLKANCDNWNEITAEKIDRLAEETVGDKK